MGLMNKAQTYFEHVSDLRNNDDYNIQETIVITLYQSSLWEKERKNYILYISSAINNFMK